MPPFYHVHMLTETVNTEKQVTRHAKCLNLYKRNENNLYHLKRQIFNLAVILNKLNQKHLRNSQCKHAPIPKTGIVTSSSKKYHVTLKTTVNFLNK